jgi:hypothetical protein
MERALAGSPAQLPPEVLPMHVVKRPPGYLVVDCFELPPLRESGIGGPMNRASSRHRATAWPQKAEDRAGAEVAIVAVVVATCRSCHTISETAGIANVGDVPLTLAKLLFCPWSASVHERQNVHSH